METLVSSDLPGPGGPRERSLPWSRDCSGQWLELFQSRLTILYKEPKKIFIFRNQ